VKARILNNGLNNQYVRTPGKKVRSQIEIYQYLYSKVKKPVVAEEPPKETAPQAPPPNPIVLLKQLKQ